MCKKIAFTVGIIAFVAFIAFVWVCQDASLMASMGKI